MKKILYELWATSDDAMRDHCSVIIKVPVKKLEYPFNRIGKNHSDRPYLKVIDSHKVAINVPYGYEIDDDELGILAFNVEQSESNKYELNINVRYGEDILFIGPTQIVDEE
jgi:hypothetical protein